MNGEKAEVVEPVQEWSPLDARYVHECPVGAIAYEVLETDGKTPLQSPAARRSSGPS